MMPCEDITTPAEPSRHKPHDRWIEEVTVNESSAHRASLSRQTHYRQRVLPPGVYTERSHRSQQLPPGILFIEAGVDEYEGHWKPGVVVSLADRPVVPAVQVDRLVEDMKDGESSSFHQS